MNRAKLFINNFLVYGLGSIISKIIPLLMLPIITSIMKDSSYYGINDMANLVISFAGAIAMMGMYDAMFRMFFEKEDNKYKKSICSTALFFVIVSSIIVCLIMYIFKDTILILVVDNTNYNLLFFIIIFNIFLSSIQGIVSAPTRMENKKKTFLIINTLSPIFSYLISIPLLLQGNYVYALPLASVISTLIMVLIFLFINRKWFSIRTISFKNLKVLIKIGLPLMPTFLMYWICNSFDRVMIKGMLDLNQLGIYSVASRIAQISQFIYTAFSMGWQYFAFSTMNDNDQRKLTVNIASYLLSISIFVSIGITALAKVVFYILAKGEYLNGFVLLPYLFISPLLLMVFQIIANQFIVVKKTYVIPLILMGAVITNIICNYYLIPIWGIEGSAIATMLGYIVAVLVCYFVTLRKKLVVKENKILISLIIFLIYILLWRILFVNSLIISITVAIVSYGILYFVYRREMKYIINIIKYKYKNTL